MINTSVLNSLGKKKKKKKDVVKWPRTTHPLTMLISFALSFTAPLSSSFNLLAYLLHGITGINPIPVFSPCFSLVIPSRCLFFYPSFSLYILLFIYLCIDLSIIEELFERVTHVLGLAIRSSMFGWVDVIVCTKIEWTLGWTTGSGVPACKLACLEQQQQQQ